VDESKWRHCGLCGEICRCSAIVCVAEKVLGYPELCHSCGGCVLVCRPGAIAEAVRETGKIEEGAAGSVRFVHGVLNVGEAMNAPLIREVKAAAPQVDLLIIDSPPGVACSAIESVRGADFVVLVTEPTPFGLNDLKLAVEMVRALRLPFGVVINRAGSGEAETHDYCRRQDIEILAELADDRRVAEAYSRGALACEAVAGFGAALEQLLARLYASHPAAQGGGR